MLIDTHCHINIMVKKKFDAPLLPEHFTHAAVIVKEAKEKQVLRIINVGTSLIESTNCVALATTFEQCYASVGIHPNDCTATWYDDFKKIQIMVKELKDTTIVALGETGLDRYHPGYTIERQRDGFRAHIECALEHDLPLIIHTRSASDEVLKILDEYKHHSLRGVIHCFSEDLAFAHHAIELGFVLGIGGTLTYPKNEELRRVCSLIDLKNIILETDAPFLPPQSIRGKENHPKEIATIAQFLAELRNEPFETIADVTSRNAIKLFGLEA